MTVPAQQVPARSSSLQPAWLAFTSYAFLVIAFLLAARALKVAAVMPHFPSAFVSFALLLLPYWLFGFGLAEFLTENLRRRWMRVVAPGLLVVPYIIYAAPRGGLRAPYVLIFLCLPIALAAWFEFSQPLRGLGWREAIALIVIGVPVEFGMLQSAWPDRGLSAMPKLLIMDAALYAFLVVRGVRGVGYDFRARWRDLAVGLREWALFAPLAIVVGLVLHFITYRPHAPNAFTVAAGWLVTFVFVAIPEELFFRGLVQNLLEQRFSAGVADAGTGNSGAMPPRTKALLIAAVCFGLSHFNKPLPFNWRYVLLATVAGIFYGRAWLDRRRLLCSGITHATVDMVWSVWFR